MSVKVYTKHPEEVREIEFDFTTSLTKNGATAVSPSVVADDGVDVQVISANAGVFTVLVGGGDYGKQYKFGLQLLDSKGGITLDLRRMRVQGPVISASFDANTDDVFVDANDG